MMHKVDLVAFNAINAKWDLGRIHDLPNTTIAISDFINNSVPGISTDWLLFWDYNLGNPPIDIIEDLIQQPVDAWHAGLKLGLQNQPDAINYIDPAWLYNKNATGDIISSSFRLSIQACLIRKSVLQKLPDVVTGFASLEMLGVSLGYALMKSGAIICHNPLLVENDKLPASSNAADEWIFIRRFFPAKWQWWVILNRSSLGSNYKYWRKAAAVEYVNLKPSIHESHEATYHKKNDATISVLAPTLDRYSYLENELRQLSIQNHKPLEVLITDQTDQANRQELDLKQYPDLTIRYFPQSEKGQCIAWNKLLEESQGEYVLFLGDDADNIQPWFIEKLMHTLHRFDADMVASNVIELKAPPREINPYYYMSDTFPITLIKRAIVEKAGNMDMFFNKNIRADYDLALRCHALGARMIFDSSALIDHHRAPAGGLRAHKARVITNSISKNSISRFAEPTVSEIFLVKKHFNQMQFKNFIRIKFFEQLIIKGSVFKKIARLMMFIIKMPGIIKRYHKNISIAEAELKTRI